MHSKDFLTYTNTSEKFVQSVGLGFPLHVSNGVLLGKTVCKALWVGKQVISIKILRRNKGLYGAALGNVVFKNMLQETEKKEYIHFKNVIV